MRILDAFGGAAAILGKSKKVVVKPNLVMPRKPDGAATTHPAVVGAVCSAFIKAGASVGVIDSTAAFHTVPVLKMLYSATGMEEMARKTGAELLYDTSSRTLDHPAGRTVDRFEIMAPVAEADAVITVGKAKTHGLTGLSGTAKNLFGAVPGLGKPGMHKRFPLREDFASMLIDLCELVSPRFAVLDAVVGMEGPGPTGGTPKTLGAVLGGFNPHAVDLAQARLMSFHPDRLPLLLEAVKRRYIPKSWEGLDWFGDDPAPLETSFAPAVTSNTGGLPFLLRHLIPKRLAAKIRAARAPYPVVAPERCVGCKKCAQICPKATVTMDNDKAVIHTAECIRCYCCHEFCPAKAIDFK